jgi:peptide-methionine (R)-S-oxide reductase
MDYPIKKTEEQWKQELGLQRYKILRQKGTYCCGACGEPLFESSSKFNSSCGWPSFDESIAGKVEYIKDTTHGMMRTEILCATCGSHLGHVFDDGPTETGTRYCVNSLSVDFKK